MATEIVRGVASKIDACKMHLKSKYESEGYTVVFQDVFAETGKYPSVVVTNGASGTKTQFGLATLAQVVFIDRKDDVEVLDAAPRLSSGRATATFMALASGGAGFPLLITSGIGAFKQKRLRKRLFEDALEYLNNVWQSD